MQKRLPPPIRRESRDCSLDCLHPFVENPETVHWTASTRSSRIQRLFIGLPPPVRRESRDCSLDCLHPFVENPETVHWTASTHSSRIQRLFIGLPPPIHRESRDCSLDFLTPSCLQRDTGTDQDPRRPWEGALYLTLHCRRQNDFPALQLALMLHSLCGQISGHDPRLF